MRNSTPASLTKIMTSYVVGQALKAGKIKLTDMVTVGKDAWATGKPGATWVVGECF
ncbi:D-alanyl-D-alanine carboxypeptidase fraction C [Salmonella enterica subsp. enterica]|uniref:D-alanyl-D-alanine carboxypeptidase fraction C n=1 Tax=Salmonella enterica I TaxID=59201 RepID=A0A447PN83_SALET|nr:D-alanyl-D-alanine carboxypeptidase fraction C [Salmonella enterica subsp. enterica]